MTKILLIHALRHSIDPIRSAFDRLWPDAELTNLLDDSLSHDLASAGNLRQEIFARFRALARYGASLHPTGILFTCSAFGPCIDAVAHELAPLPVLKPNQAVIEEAIAVGGRIGVLASFAPTLAHIVEELRIAAPSLDVSPMVIEGALEALSRGDGGHHDSLAADAALSLAGCDAILLAQFSLARAAAAVADATGLRVLTAPGGAVRRLRRMVSGRATLEGCGNRPCQPAE
jgi:hypothetical protein